MVCHGGDDLGLSECRQERRDQRPMEVAEGYPAVAPLQRRARLLTPIYLCVNGGIDAPAQSISKCWRKVS